MKNLQFNPYQHGMSLKSLNLSSFHGMRLKSCPIPVLLPLQSEENLRRAK